MGKKGGFTLIELLVVVAIIALLVSILVPAVQKAREQAARAVCAVNLHHWGIALNTYAYDNDGSYPPNALWHHDFTLIRPSTYQFGGPEYTQAEALALMEQFAFYQWHARGAAFWSCPNLAAIGSPRPPYWTEWFGGVYVLTTGYTYTGDMASRDLNWYGWSEEPHAPGGPADPGKWNLMNDHNYRIWWPVDVFRMVAHVEGGGAEDWTLNVPDVPPYGEAVESAGGNQLYNDGSASWADFEELDAICGSSGWFFHYWKYE